MEERKVILFVFKFSLEEEDKEFKKNMKLYLPDLACLLIYFFAKLV